MQPLIPDPPKRIRVIFIDDEMNVLDGLRRSMHSMRGSWEMTFASSGAEALTLMSRFPPDVVVSDMRMPGMNGADLLALVRRNYPQAVRFILSGYADASSVMQLAGVAHQYLSKPCDSGALKVAISRTGALRELLAGKALLDSIGDMDSLPSLPSVYQNIVACLQGPDPTITDIARIISSDLVMTTLVLKLANSAFFGAKQAFRTAERAVAFLGVNTISGLVLAHSIFNESAAAKHSGISLEKLWHHSLQTATYARTLALYEKWSPDRAEEAFLSGVLHDLGELVLATRAVLPESESLTHDAQPVPIGDQSHGEVAAYLLGLWGFSDTLIEAVAFHHRPSRALGGFGLAGLLHVADRLAHRINLEAESEAQGEVEIGYLESLDMQDRLSDWQMVLAASPA